MQIQSQDLIAALLRTQRDIVHLDCAGARIASLTPMQAIRVAQSNPHTGSVRGHHGQVRSIRAVKQERSLPWQSCWRTTDAAVLPAYGWDKR